MRLRGALVGIWPEGNLVHGWGSRVLERGLSPASVSKAAGIVFVFVFVGRVVAIGG